jgi:hypothetical protein
MAVSVVEGAGRGLLLSMGYPPSILGMKNTSAPGGTG